MVDLGVSKAQLASLLGTVPETLARMTAADMIVSESNRHVYITGRSALGEMAEGLPRLS